MKNLFLLFLLGCGVDQMPPVPHGDAWTVTWARTGHSDSPGVPAPVACTETISHPCPFILYTTKLVIADGQFTWTDATGGTDEAGVAAADRLPWIDPVMTATDGSLVLEEHGDDGGFRMPGVLAPGKAGGWSGDITWALFTVAGQTTFHVDVSP